MSNDEKNKFFNEHPRIAQFEDRLTSFCELSEDEQEDVIEDFIEKHVPEARDLDDYDLDDYDLDDMLDRYCEMTDEQKDDFFSMHEKSEDHLAKMNEYCELDDDAKMKFIEEHRNEYQSHMKDKMSEYKKEHKI